ncbi:tyrosine-type recombinase/integrase [Porphyrobacter sp. CACIAM 03H1]|uniref:tyrosine-type recombinase/integrase n=1 Tax=Porphyrobacter sp. CACIAM 03H1 TaxID=2003315 RepID=UPI000B5A4BB6|nr:tyrosine-type recombinase/integrase [Porphyrobacter sp. CACIAM 03H1]ASJ91687.1 hypothetical protein CBR61_12685 [Porphyrobacter sp. CACIAM 03H1]
MASLRQRHHKFEAKVRVPTALRVHYGDREYLYRTLAASNRRAAVIEAAEWETGLKLEWAAERGHDCEALDGLRGARRIYQHIRAKAAAGAYRLEVANEEPGLAGIDHELDKLAFLHGPAELSPVDAAKVAALQDAARELRGLPAEPRKELEPTLSEVAEEHMRWWSSQQGLKETNTGNQKRATYRLFASFFGDKPLREVRRADAARFMDGLQTLDPVWGRSREARELSWAELQRKFGGNVKGLSSSSLNRHSAALAALWRWAEERDYCSGRNPFTSFRTRLKQGINVQGYEAWEAEELNHLFADPPKRADLREVILVGLFSGMRINEIASLTGDQLRERDGVRYIAVRDAKTPAGNREVPLHSRLGWLWERKESAGTERLWPSFNGEGPGKKAGADAGREFSHYKKRRGFTSRTKAFHSFRKNVTRIMERARVHENEWAQVLGHEKGFTYGRYNADGITLEHKAAIIELIAYPGVNLLRPGEGAA